MVICKQPSGAFRSFGLLAYLLGLGLMEAADTTELGLDCLQNSLSRGGGARGGRPLGRQSVLAAPDGSEASLNRSVSEN